MIQRGRDPFSRKPVQGPEQNQVKLHCRASANMRWKCGRFDVPPVSWSTYSPETCPPCFAQYSRRAISLFSVSWRPSFVLTRAYSATLSILATRFMVSAVHHIVAYLRRSFIQYK